MTDALRRKTDTWIGKCASLWDWFDNRQIDRHLLSAVLLYISWQVTVWAMAFAAAHPTDGAGTIAAITGPWMLAQAAAIKFILDSRDKP